MGLFAFGAGKCRSISFQPAAFNQLVQGGSPGRPRSFHDLAALVDDVGGGRQAHIAQAPSHRAGVVNGDLEGQLARFGKVDHVAGRVVAHGDRNGVKPAAVELLVGCDDFRASLPRRWCSWWPRSSPA